MDGELEEMKRTPQPTLTQSRLTGFGVLKIQGATQTQGAKTTPVSGPTGARDRSFSEGDSMTITETFKSPERSRNMDTSTPEQNRKRPRSTNEDEGMKEFFLQALNLNKEEIIISFQLGLGELSKRVEDNTRGIAANKEDMEKQCSRVDGHDVELEKLTARVRALERSEPRKSEVPRRAALSEAYLKARRSVRLWPVVGTTKAELWGNAGEFLHGPLAVSESDMGQYHVEAGFPASDPVQPEGIRNEDVVRFRSSRIRDMVMSYSVNLAGCVGPDGRPTVGTRLEIPGELKDTFRLLSLLGTRLRARHGEGTKRHVKFDDFTGSLFSNIKLPGDTKWTRVTPEMARSDLEALLREENEANQKMLASKLVPGPRESLHRPAADSNILQLARSATPFAPVVGAASPSGKRPRWSGPQRRPPT